jgi:hypothetical protein
MDTWVRVVLAGIGATALTDLWAIARKPVFGVPPPNYAMVGRWLAHMPHGRFRHASIVAAAPMPGEAAIGWTAHYLIGVGFACLLLLFAGAGWFTAPTPGPALAVGIATVAAPFLLLQPGMGAGIAASRMPRPNSARLQSLLMHAVFGLGLFAVAYALR